MKSTNAPSEEWAALVNNHSQYPSSTFTSTLSPDTRVSDAVNMINSVLQPPQPPSTFRVGSKTMIPQVQAPVAYGPQDAQDQSLPVVPSGSTVASNIPLRIPPNPDFQAGQRHGQDASDVSKISDSEYLQAFMSVLFGTVNRDNGPQDAETVTTLPPALSTTHDDSKRARISPDTVVCRDSAKASHQQPMQVPNVMDYRSRIPQTGQLVYPTPSPSPTVPDQVQQIPTPFTFRPTLGPVINREVKKLPARGYKGPLRMPPAITYVPQLSHPVTKGLPSLKRKLSLKSRDAHKHTPDSDIRIYCKFTTTAGHVCNDVLVDNEALVTKHCKEHARMDELPNIAECPFCTPKEHKSEGALEKSACSAFGRHIFLYHFYKKDFPCQDCDKTYDRPDSLHRHRKEGCAGLAQQRANEEVRRAKRGSSD